MVFLTMFFAGADAEFFYASSQVKLTLSISL